MITWCTPTEEEARELERGFDLGAYLREQAAWDRVSHLFPRGFDRTQPARAYCGTLIEPPFKPDTLDYILPDDLCVVCAELRGVWEP